MATFDDVRIREMLQGRRAVRSYALPFAPEILVGVRVLSDSEIDDARVAAQRYVKERGIDVDVDPDFLERETRRQMIWRAFVNHEAPDQAFFPSFKQVRELDAELIRAMFDVYYEHQAWCSPLRHLDAEKAQELADALGKGPSPSATLASFDADSLRSLCISLALALRSSSPTNK